MTTVPQFSPNQIVCIEQNAEFVFGEVVQMVPSRGLCWARPIAIARPGPSLLLLELVQDLRDSSDLLLPAVLFREALDTEVLPLMTALLDPEKPVPPQHSQEARRWLNQFVQQICQVHPEVFVNPPVINPPVINPPVINPPITATHPIAPTQDGATPA
ncbi:hypothetical protein [Alkalinema sp. FACHB-956]|uniref:hypothetical protein n=1 Tax=Alkalinema sp. FACHB-956 TaxID=2692768 RepID=UPI0016857D96|nr:hypothetical protein [Alkalinema sp. FACHB-956]MBD2327381.1 hypothetical protein [Alkalinema sp. FACHB-956]